MYASGRRYAVGSSLLLITQLGRGKEAEGILGRPETREGYSSVLRVTRPPTVQNLCLLATDDGYEA